MRKKLPKSIRKHIRKEKARIHREVLDIKEQEKLIQEIYKKFLKNQNESIKMVLLKQDNKKNFSTAPLAPSLLKGERTSENQR